MAYNKMDGDSDAAEAQDKARGKKVSLAKKVSRNVASTGMNHKTGRYTPEAMKHMLSTSSKGYSEGK